MLEKLSADIDVYAYDGSHAMYMASMGRHQAIVSYLTDYKIQKQVQQQLDQYKLEAAIP